MIELSSLYQYHYISDSHKMRKGLDIVKPVPHNSQSRSLAVSQSRSLAVSQSRSLATGIVLFFLHADSIIFSHYRIGKERHCVLQHSFLPATFMHHQKSTYPKIGGSYA